MIVRQNSLPPIPAAPRATASQAAQAARPVKILGTGVYVPKTRVPSTEIDRRLGKRTGWTERLFGIRARYFAGPGESTSFMAAQAARDALTHAALDASGIDCIIAACGVAEQPIPTTAVLVQNKLGLGNSGIPAFDVNSTCLSFVTAFDIAADRIALGRSRRVLIVSSDIASCGLDWSNPETAAIFGDGAAAVIVGACDANDTARLIASRMSTYGAYQDACRLEAGGTRLSPHRASDQFWDGTTFKMDGRAAFTCVIEHMPEFVDGLCHQAGLATSAIDIAILHQASNHSLISARRMLGFSADRFVTLFPDFGNQIATSIPHGLHRAINGCQLKRGQTAIILGSSAGISLGGLVLQY